MNYYFHVPFCRSKCGYCAFYSLPEPSPELIDSYLDRLERTFFPEAPAETIYIGGGTPTFLSAPQLERLLKLIHERLAPPAGTEISCEANPETVDREKVALLRRHVTRISLGVQSFHPIVRRNIGRKCSDEALDRALELIRDADFPHWNIDLIFALPGQTPEAFFTDAQWAIEAGADHLSCYALTAEENAALELPEDDDLAAEMMPEIARFMEEQGFSRYEVSNFARPGAECRHNCNVWRGGLLAGVGPGACGFDGTDRWRNPLLEPWLRGEAPERDAIFPAARLNEIFAVNLRTAAGWTEALWRQVPKADPWSARQAIFRAAAASFDPSWFRISDERLALTGKGMMFWNSVAGEIIAHGT